MKCPKCSYLGFEASDRCRNCGYDFSLVTNATASGRVPDLPLRDSTPSTSTAATWDDAFRGAPTPATVDVIPGDSLTPMSFDAAVAAPVVSAPGPASSVDRGRTMRAAASSLPLFQPGADDEPLIKLPASPRPPLAVRRTPDKPRLRAVSKHPRRATEPVVAETVEPALAFVEEPIFAPPIHPETPIAERPTASASERRTARADSEDSGPVRRLSAAAIDHGILFAIDATVIYFTLKMAALELGQWSLLPPVPLVAFLGLVKAAYFGAFTLIGGQTIGKMATRIRVVGEDGGTLEPTQAIRRTAVGTVSLLAAGIGFLPMLIAPDRRGLHDRVARTRVVRV